MSLTDYILRADTSWLTSNLYVALVQWAQSLQSGATGQTRIGSSNFWEPNGVYQRQTIPRSASGWEILPGATQRSGYRSAFGVDRSYDPQARCIGLRVLGQPVTFATNTTQHFGKLQHTAPSGSGRWSWAIVNTANRFAACEMLCLGSSASSAGSSAAPPYFDEHPHRLSEFARLNNRFYTGGDSLILRPQVELGRNLHNGSIVGGDNCFVSLALMRALAQVVFQGAADPIGPTLYLGLSRARPANQVTGRETFLAEATLGEVDAPDYFRIPLPRTTARWPRIDWKTAGGFGFNSPFAVTFGPAENNWDRVLNVFLCDVQTGGSGTLLGWMNVDRTINTGDRYIVTMSPMMELF